MNPKSLGQVSGRCGKVDVEGEREMSRDSFLQENQESQSQEHQAQTPR